MKGPKRHRGLSGTVLIMILTVMVVLIIMLMATLSVVTTANQRIYTKFEENQAYYTARSALDVFTKNMLSDKKYYAQDGSGDIKYVHGKNVTSDKMTQGLGLQLDLYSINTLKDDAGNYLGANVLQKALTPYADGKSGSDEAKDEYKTYFGVTDENVTYLEYLITLPAINDGDSDPDGKFSGTGAADLNTVKIKVEVMDRTYGLGTYTDTSGAEATVPEGDEKAFVMGTEGPSGTNYSSISDSQKAEAIFNGVRKKDTMKLKITATTTFEGVEGKAVLIYDTNEPMPNNSSNAITSFGGGGADNMSILGGLSMGGDSKPSNDGIVYGNSYIEGAYSSGNNGQEFHITDGESVYIKDGLFIQNSGGGHTAFIGYGESGSADKKPFVYIDGDASKNDGTETYTDYSMVIGNMNNGTTYFKDVDVITEKGIKVLENQFGWKGNIYCNGDFNLVNCQNVKIEGDLYVDGDIILKTSGGDNNFTISYTRDEDGNIEVTSYNFNNVTGKVYCKGGVYEDEAKTTNLIDGAAHDSTGKFNKVTSEQIELPSAADIQDPKNDKQDLEISLPGSVKKTLKTHYDNFASHYQVDDVGNLVPDPSNPGKYLPIDSETYSGKIFSQADFISDALPLNGVSEIDTSAGDKKYYIDNTYSAFNLNIKGGGRAEIVLTGTSYEQFTILVDDSDKTELVLYFANPGACRFSNGLEIYTTTSKAAKDKTGTLHAGDHMADSTKKILVPHINIYSVASSIEICNRYFLTGYFYGPNTELNSTVNGSGIDTSHITYNSATVTGSGSPVFNMIGSVLCAKFNMPNKPGIAYINPALDDEGNAGDPIHGWNAYRYARN